MKIFYPVMGLLMSAVVQCQEPETVASVNKDPLAIIKAVKQDLTGLTALFQQYELIGEDKTDVNTGQVWMQSPNFFRWQYQQPYEQLIVADGENVWVYDEDLEQVTVKKQDNQMNPIYIIINDDMAQNNYQIEFEKTDKGVDWVSLTPRIHHDEVQSVWLAVAESTVKKIKVFNKFSQVMVFEFSDVQRNPEFKADFFQFTPPEGVDVVRALDGDFE